MPSLELYGGGGLLPRDARQTARALSRTNARTQLRQMAVDSEVDVAISKIEGVTMATGAGMQAVVRVSKALESLEQMAPGATARLNLLADDHVLGVAATLQDLRYRMRRI